ncbi:SUMF1/EgtB/PvdO family nonheme iron enzyme [Roseovarius salinarum]|uniref:SUMF1/EgtB/PvdO family nonheme iron enzyme n=1 Tax=Roseovarius salinarum TaxID=1981892 RepID=UPI000C32485E|nr:SUMF1/EgtB/PvdO family nonheme iron enzyme [Roseovarius salinarum]
MKLFALLSAGALAAGAALVGLQPPITPAPAVQTIAIPAGEIPFRPVGNFSRAGKTVSASPQPVRVDAFEIMKYQVSRARYAACVDAGACRASVTGEGSFPQTQVSWRDADAYARWLSEVTGETWRLPTAPEWQRAAAERFAEVAVESDGADPAARWLGQYGKGTALRDGTEAALKPAGGFGENSMGVADIAGSVWEWTSGCMQTGIVDADGRLAEAAPYCGARLAGGRHRAIVIDFVRDASVGGCAVGLPPDHLGFRLVRD